MNIKIKKLNKNAVIPKYAKDGDAGLDLVATSFSLDEFGNAVFGTGLAFEIPKGYVGLLFPRSSISRKNYQLSNSVGVLDSGYRGEVMFKFKASVSFEHNNENVNDFIDFFYKIGDRIGQILILPYPEINFIESENLSKTERGTGGYGSTGN